MSEDKNPHLLISVERVFRECAQTNVHNRKAMFGVLGAAWAITWTKIQTTTTYQVRRCTAVFALSVKTEIGAPLNSTRNYNSHETTTFECPSSTHRGPEVATTVKRRLLHLAINERQILHSQRPPNYNNCESTAVKWRLVQNRATTAKCNNREVTSKKLHNCCKICVRFCVASWLLSFQVPFGSLWEMIFFPQTVFAGKLTWDQHWTHAKYSLLFSAHWLVHGCCCTLGALWSTSFSDTRGHTPIHGVGVDGSGARRRGRTLRKGVSLPSKHLLSAPMTPPSKNPSKNPCPYWSPYEAPSKNPSKKHFLERTF